MTVLTLTYTCQVKLWPLIFSSICLCQTKTPTTTNFKSIKWLSKWKSLLFFNLFVYSLYNKGALTCDVRFLCRSHHLGISYYVNFLGRLGSNGFQLKFKRFRQNSGAFRNNEKEDADAWGQRWQFVIQLSQAPFTPLGNELLCQLFRALR